MPENADNATPESTPPAPEAGSENPPENPPAGEAGEPNADEGEKALGDAGKKALDAMKAARNDARAEAAELKAKLEALEAAAAGKEAEHAAAVEAQRVKDEAIAAANERIKKAEVRAQAAGKLNDPADALKFLDLSEFEVDSDGEVDTSSIAQAIKDLIEERPYLAAQGGRFQASADGGARNESAGTGQLTRADLDRMSPDEIDKAHREGRFADVLAGKR